MSTSNVVLLSWDEPSRAYEAFSKFRNADSLGITVSGAAVVERTASGELRVTDGQDNVIGLATLGGGSLGALIGVLGGPLGVLLGFASGGLIGSAFDLTRDSASEGVIAQMSQALPPGHAGVIAELREDSPAELDEFAKSSGATLLRRGEEDVLDELAAAEIAADAAAQAAHEQVRAEKHAERREHRQERIDRLKARFQHSD